MPSVPPAAGHTPSQRTLAAIVFTDAVNFSARMHADEVGTLKLLQRDFVEMRRLCAEYEGTVLKTTGDGLLLTFTSAVQAVACALAMQRQFATEAKAGVAGETMLHRVGIHLGDVLIQDQDVMGDGVNIASRLQAEAEPGGICISQTVYDVVKNKLQMQVVSLGARDLKNIAQAMPIYSLVLEAQARGPVPGGANRPVGRRPASPGRRKLWLALGSVAALALVFAAGVIFNHRAPAPSATTVAPVTAPPSALKSPALAATAGPEAGDLAVDLAGEFTKRKDVMQQLHAKYLDKYDFNGLVRALRDQGESPTAPAGLQQMLRSAEMLLKMQGWLDVALRHHNKEHPLLVHDLSGDATKDAGVYVAADLRVVFLESGAPRSRDWTELKPAEYGAIIVSALREGKEAQRGVILGANAFARFFNLPSMTAALATIKARREKDPADK